MVGKGPHDPTIGYPEHVHHRKVGDLASSVSFVTYWVSINVVCSMSAKRREINGGFSAFKIRFKMFAVNLFLSFNQHPLTLFGFETEIIIVK